MQPQQGFELFRLPNGLSSRDLIRQSGLAGANDVMAFHGSMWKFSDSEQKTGLASQMPIAPHQQAPKIPGGIGEPDMDAGLVPNDQVPPQGGVEASDKYTAESLAAMSKDELVEIAAGLGVTDVGVKKDKLVKAILDKQG